MLLRGPSQKIFDQSICRTKEQKTRLQRLARAMPTSVMPSTAKNGKVLKRKNLAVIANTPRLKHFFLHFLFLCFIERYRAQKHDLADARP